MVIATDYGKVGMNYFSWWEPYFTPISIRKVFLKDHILSKISNDVSVIKRSVTSKDVQQ